ncbi:MAG: hypothetical protein V4642_10125 [Bacteroidota bacterium]
MDEPQTITRLFAVEADRLLDGGQALEAAQLCESGLKVFPDYPTGYAILARAYIQLGDKALAGIALARGIKRFPLHKFLLRVKSEMGFADDFAEIPPDSSLKESEVLKDNVLKDNVLKDNVLKDDILKDESPITDADFKNLPKEELIIDDEIISEDDIEDPAEIEADPAVEEVSESEAEIEQKEFDEVFKNTDEQAVAAPEEVVIDDEIILEDDIEEDIPEPEADFTIEEISEAEAEDEREEFEKVFKSDEDEVLKGDVLKEILKPSLPASANNSRYSPLRIIETFKTDENSRKSLKSMSVRLIPGLEFAPLRFESNKKYDRHISALPEPPQFRAFKMMQRVNYAVAHPSMFHRMGESPEQQQSSQGNLIQRRAEEAGRVAQNLTPLEELVTRLEKARIPTVQEDIDPQAGQFAREPSVVTETMAKIYEQQGALNEALKAYQVLARQKPEKLAHFEEKIHEIQLRMSE